MAKKSKTETRIYSKIYSAMNKNISVKKVVLFEKRPNSTAHVPSTITVKAKLWHINGSDSHGWVATR
jgi:hypothetical protein